MSHTDTLEWEEIEAAASEMFKVWIDGSELEWAKEAWSHLTRADLASAGSILDITSAKLRLVTLARIYQEFCGYAWDENPETPVEYLAEDLEIDPVALGVLAGSIEPLEFQSCSDDYELRQAALVAVTDSQRLEIFECLRAAYGDEIRLYSRIWHTRSLLAEKDSEGEEFEVTGANCSALEYVQNGFRR